MKMKKLRKALSVFLIVALIVGLVPAQISPVLPVQAASDTPTAVLTGTCGDNITWTLTEDTSEWDLVGTHYSLTLTGSGLMTDYSSYVSVPWYSYRGKITSISIDARITSIANYAFYECTSLKSVNIPNKVTTIGNYAFYRNYLLQTIVFGSGLKTIGNYAFGYCNNDLTEVSFQSGLLTVGEYAFTHCTRLQKVTLPSTVTEIKRWAFSYCYNLSNAPLPTNLKTLGDACFYNASLTTITIPKTLTVIGSQCFYSNTGLSEIKVASGNSVFSVQDNVLYKKVSTQYTVVAYAVGVQTTQITLKTGTVRIDDYAFAYAYNLKDITLPASLTTIGNSAFYFSGISSVNFTAPAKITTIEGSAFYYCSSLTSIALPDSLTSIGSWAFNRTGLVEINTNNVETIGSNAFGSCSRLKTVNIGKALKSLNGIAFEGSNSLNIITVSDENPNLDDIDNVVFNKNHTKLLFYAFAKAGDVYHVPDTVEQMEAYSIYNVPSLKELYIPEAVNNISTNGIWKNKKLKSVYFKGNAPAIANGSTNASNPISSFSITENAANLLVYRTEASTGWEDAKWSSYVFADYYPESEVKEEGTVGAIKWTYEGTNGRVKLTNTTENAAITQLPDFVGDSPAPWNQYMNQIQTVEAEGINGIGDYNFQGAEKLIRLEADEKLLKIGEYGFENCKKLLFIDIASAERIGACAFKNNARITGAVTGFLTLDKVVTIGSEAFKGCSSITKATLGSQLTSLEAGVFADCTELSNFTIPESVTAIKKQALSGCTKLRTINIPANVNFIGESAFANNTTLEKVYFKGVALQGEEWANNSFENCNENLTLYYEKDQTSWVAFGGHWNGLPLQGIGHYTEQRDHYSFANTRDSFGYAQDYRVPRQRYVDVIGDIISGTYYYSINRTWGGSCFGMTSTTLEFYENINEKPEFQLASYDTEIETLYEIGAPRDKNSAITKLIEAYQLSQYKSFMAGCGGTVSKNLGNYKGLYDKVEEFERSGGLAVDSQAEPIVLLIYTAFSGHAVIPISVDQDSNGNFLFQVYDPNLPSQIQTITMPKDYSRIYYAPSYTCSPFTYASFIGYTEIAQNMSDLQLHESNADQSVYLSINKEDGAVTNAAGDGIDKMKGAYEQKFFNAEEVDEFSGIKSFVLPKGDTYQITSKDSQESDNTSGNDTTGENTTDTTQGSVTFYMASDESFAEVNSSDENAVLQVNDETTEDGQMEIALQSESEGEENAVITLMNPQGMERIVEVEGSNATVTTEANNTITVEVPAGEEVRIDGKKVEVIDGKAVGSFEAKADENPLVADDLETSVFCNEENKLQGDVNASVISRIGDVKDVTVTATYFDQNDTKVASYSEVKTLQSGLNFISLSFDELSADFGGMDFEEIGSELKLSCLLTVKDDENHFVSAIASGLTVSPTITPNPDEPEPEKPNPDNPNPDNPEPEKPNPDTPNPDNPEPEKPNPDNPNPDNPEPEKPDPGTDEEVAVTSVEAAKKVLTLNVGESYQAIVTVLPSNATDKKLSFKASNDNVVVTEEGKITAKKVGTCVVTATASNGISTTITVTIKDIPKQPPTNTNTNQNTVNKSVAVTSVKVSKKKLVLGKGETYQIKASVAPKNATNKKLIYRTTNKTVSVNAKGLIKAKKTGTSKVTIVASNGKKAVIAVTVKKAPKKLNLNAVKKTLKVGKTFKIKAKLPKGTASCKLTYSSNKKSVAKVSSTGKVTAKKKGTAMITVKTFNKKKAKIKIIVK